MENVVTGGEDRKATVEGRVADGHGSHGPSSARVNGATVAFDEPSPKGGHILDKAGFTPADDYVLIQLLGHSTRSIALDEVVDLRGAGTAEFRAFKTDCIFRFTLNDHGFDWGMDKIAVEELRRIAHVPADDVLVLEREDHDIDLGADTVLDLGQPGTEHLRTEKRLITVYFENESREIPRGVYTTEQLKKEFGVQDGYILEYINDEGQLTPLKPGAKLRVKEGMKFFEQVPCGGSS